MIDVRVGDTVQVTGFGTDGDSDDEREITVVGRVVDLEEDDDVMPDMGRWITIHDASLDGPQDGYAFDVDDVNTKIVVIAHAID